MAAGNDKMIFLSHTGKKPEQKDFMRELNRVLHTYIGCNTFFDESIDNLPPGSRFPDDIMAALWQCKLGVVLLSDQFLRQRWPMMELIEFIKRARQDRSFRIVPLFYDVPANELYHLGQYHQRWQELHLNVDECVAAVHEVRQFSGVERKQEEPLNGFLEKCKERIVHPKNGVAPAWLEDKQQGRADW